MYSWEVLSIRLMFLYVFIELYQSAVNIIDCTTRFEDAREMFMYELS